MKMIDVRWQPINRIEQEIIKVKMNLPTRISREESQPLSEERVKRSVRCHQREIRSSLEDPALRTGLALYEQTSSRSSRNTLGLILDAMDHLKNTITQELVLIDQYDNIPFHFNRKINTKKNV